MKRAIGLVLVAALFSGCLATRSPVRGEFGRTAAPNLNAAPVSVLFVFRHEAQLHGFDTIPEAAVLGREGLRQPVPRRAARDRHSISRYKTFTELPSDVSNPKRREELAASRAAADDVIEVECLEESSFRQQALMGTRS